MSPRRLGPAAWYLERLLFRDGHGFDEAVAILESSGRVEVSREALEAIHEKLPPRTPRRFVGEQALATVEAVDSESDAGVLAQKGAAGAARGAGGGRHHVGARLRRPAGGRRP